MTLIEQIAAALHRSKLETWAELSERLGKPRSYGRDIHRIMRRKIEWLNNALGYFGYELKLKKKSK
jgi:hypothetical protein